VRATPKSRGGPLGRIRGGGTYDSWLGHFHGELLRPLDEACAGRGTEALQLLRDLDDDLWAVLLTRDYSLYPNIRGLLPGAPEPELQVRWNGAFGLELINEGKAFYARVKEACERHSRTPLSRAAVLDFGCGWGRLTRFFARDVAPGSLYGCDPVESILDVCRRTRVPASFARSEFVPDRLPFERSFDLVYAFSVFTHLSERAHEHCLRAIHEAMRPGALLVATIRPPAYLAKSPWLADELESLGRDPLAAMAEPRFVFAPHPVEEDHPQYQGEDMTYGEAVISLSYVRERWAPRFELLDVGLLSGDMHQVVLTLRRGD
jgi:SAM-dependent methyltransferase